MSIKPKLIKITEKEIRKQLKIDNIGIGLVFVDSHNTYRILRKEEFKILREDGGVATYVFQMKKNDIMGDFAAFIEEIAVMVFIDRSERSHFFDAVDYFSYRGIEEIDKATAHEKMGAIAWCNNRLDEIKAEFFIKGIRK